MYTIKTSLEVFIMSERYKLPGEPKCPNCHNKIDGFTQVDLKDVQMKVGDYSICSYCATGMSYEGESTFRALTEEEVFLARLTMPEFRKAEEAIRRLQSYASKKDK
jgi:hypothetical protein